MGEEPMKDNKNSIMESVRSVVFKESENLEGSATPIQGYDFNKGVNYAELFKSMLSTGFQASNLGDAIQIVNQMLDWRLSHELPTEDCSEEERDVAYRESATCKIFLGFTSNLVSSGVRDTICYLVQHRMVDVVVTTAGGIEEDLIKCLAPTYKGDFSLAGAVLRSKGLNRIGNLLVPNDNYCKFENWIIPIFDQMYEEQIIQKVLWTPSKVIARLGKEINDETSYLYWAYKVCLRENGLVCTALESLSSEDRNLYVEDSDNPSGRISDEFSSSKRALKPNDVSDSESSDSDSSADPDISQTVSSAESMDENTAEVTSKEDSSSKTEVQSSPCSAEDFATWQRIIRLDAIHANAECIAYSPSQAGVSEARAHCFAEAVGLKDYEHLELPRILHAARLVSIPEAYALYDPEIGYCQGMSDLLSPLIAVMTEDHEAFWCFVGFMKKARHNFRLDEVGIRRQLNIISKIIKHKDSHLYRHLEKLQAEDCFFLYSMVVVLFRRELNFEQTLCQWEVMWADQAAIIRAAIGKSSWSRIRLRAPPTDDLLLYAIAASVLQWRKQIIEKYSSMDEILRECQSMVGQLDVWKLLDPDLVVTLHEKI